MNNKLFLTLISKYFVISTLKILTNKLINKIYLKPIINLKYYLFLLILFNLIFVDKLYSAKQIQQVNYFSSLRASETNVRSGPGQNYPIKFIYKLKGIPVRVISEYDNWYEIEDYDGQTGWITQSLVTKKRTLMVYSKKPSIEMRRKPKIDSHLVFRLENFVIAEYLKCQEQFCAVKINGKKGWVEKNDVFGIDSERKNINDSQLSSSSQNPSQINNNGFNSSANLKPNEHQLQNKK